MSGKKGFFPDQFPSQPGVCGGGLPKVPIWWKIAGRHQFKKAVIIKRVIVGFEGDGAVTVDVEIFAVCPLNGGGGIFPVGVFIEEQERADIGAAFFHIAQGQDAPVALLGIEVRILRCLGNVDGSAVSGSVGIGGVRAVAVIA